MMNSQSFPKHFFPHLVLNPLVQGHFKTPTYQVSVIKPKKLQPYFPLKPNFVTERPTVHLAARGDFCKVAEISTHGSSLPFKSPWAIFDGSCRGSNIRRTAGTYDQQRPKAGFWPKPKKSGALKGLTQRSPTQCSQAPGKP